MDVISGMDPHKRSATIEVIDEQARVLAAGRYGTDTAGYAQMLAAGRKFAGRVWAVEGCNGIGRHLAHRLVHDGEVVFDLPPKLSAQVRVFAAGNGRKTDEVDAHSVVLAALRAPCLVQIQAEEDLVVMGMLADRRDELGRARTQVINRLHRLLLELGLSGTRARLRASDSTCTARACQPLLPLPLLGWPASPAARPPSLARPRPVPPRPVPPAPAQVRRPRRLLPPPARVRRPRRLCPPPRSPRP